MLPQAFFDAACHGRNCPVRRFLCSSGNVSNPCGDLTGALCKRIFRRGSARCGPERLFVSEQSDTPVRFSDRTGVSFMQLEETQYSSSLKKFIYIDIQLINNNSSPFSQTNHAI